jgi:predicted metalloendopeptidase
MQRCSRLGSTAFGLAVMALTAAAFTALPASAQTPQPAREAAPPLFGGMDPSIAPGVDFFGYANGGWLKTAEIPADLSSYGPFDQLIELNEKRLSDLIRDVARSNPPAGSDERKVADFYASYMDEKRIETRGLSVLEPTFRTIAAISDRAALARYLGGTLRADVDVLNATRLYTENLFGLWIAKDLDDPTRYSPFLLQGGLGMTDRDYYLKDSPQMAKTREQYRAHIAALLRLTGDSQPAQKAERIFGLELLIARAHATRAESEDVRRGDNHWSKDRFRSEAPGLDWDQYWRAAGLPQQNEFVVWQPDAVRGISALVANQPLALWKDYLKYHAVNHMAGLLPKRFVEEDFAFYGKVLEGTPELRARWKRATDRTSAALGEPVGKLYVQAYFPPATKASIEDLVHNLLEAFEVRIDALQWMAPETKIKAKAKLSTLNVQVGYPDRWLDYSPLQIDPGDAFGNAQRVELFDYQRNVAKLGRPIDRSEWVMTPQMVNAVNLPVMNALNFPAAILQPPFFDPKRPTSLNYGAIGAIIGHEISHSFDDQGALFDAEGRLQDWWTPQDYAHFKAASQQLVKQFDGYRPFPDLAVNGAQTLSENIADVAGLATAYTAFRQSLASEPAPVVEDFTGDQQFFLSFEQTWREKIRDAALRETILSDGHAPGQYRALTVRNLDEWYPAFDVKPGQALYLDPPDRVHIW